jgi:PAS domain S-box-containing protein
LSILSHQHEKEYQSIFENALEGIFQSSLDGRYLKVNPAMVQIYGYDSPEEMLVAVKNIGKQIYVDAREREGFLREIEANGRIDKFEAQNYRKNGEIFWSQTNARIVHENGNVSFIEGFTIDITSHKQNEFALKQSEEQFKKIFLSNPIASCITTLKEDCFIAANDAFWEMSNFAPEECFGHTSVELGIVTKAKRRKHISKLKKGIPVRNESGKLVTKSGKTCHTLEFFDLVSFDGQECLMVMFHDISEQVKTQQTLQESEEKYRQLFEAESYAVFLIDNEGGNILEANETATTLYGYTKEELLCKKNSELSAEPEKTRQVTINSPLDKERVISIPLRFHKKKDGTIFPVEISGRFFEWRGRPVHIASIHDITDRKNAEEALITSEERFRLAFHTSPDSISINRLKDGLYVDINEGFSNITGYSREEIIGKTSLEVNIWGNQKDRDKLVNELIEHGFVNNLEAPFRMKDGRIITGLMSARIITLNNTLNIIAVTREIETIKKAEATLQKQLKELSILHNIAVAASSSKSEDELLQRTTDTIGDTLHPDNCGVELVTENGENYQAHSSYRAACRRERDVLGTNSRRGLQRPLITA